MKQDDAPQKGMKPVLPDLLEKFIDDPATLHERIILKNIPYVKVVDKELHESRYVLLRTDYAVYKRLELYQTDRNKQWRMVLQFDPDMEVFHFVWARMMDDGISIVLEYADQMALFK